MYRFLIPFLTLISLAVAVPAWAQSTSASANLSIGVTQSQTINSVTLSSNSFAGGAASGTVVGTIGVTMSPAAPPFSGTLSLGGTNASSFQIVGTNLETKGIVPAGTYQISIVAIEAGATGSPFTQAETITGTSPTASTCSQGTAFISVGDGCHGAQASGSWQVTNFFSGYTGTAYSAWTGCNIGGYCRPPWNVAGVDYAIGYTGTLNDPVTSGPACLSLIGSAGRYTAQIVSLPCTIQNLDFTLHSGIQIYVNGGVTGSGALLFKNDHFGWNTNSNSTVALINIQTGSITSCTFEYSQIDDSHSSSNEENASIQLTACGSVLVEYSVFRSPAQHAIYVGGKPESVTLEYNYTENVGVSPNHGNFDYLSTSSNLVFTTSWNTECANCGGGGNATTLAELDSQGPATETQVSSTANYNVVVSGPGSPVSTLIELGDCRNNGTALTSDAAYQMQNNYMDRSGTAFYFINTTCVIANPPSCSKNKDMTTGNTVTATVAGATCS